MADILQGEQLPSSITTTQQQQVAPEFYTNYLQDIANLGQNAVTAGGVAGFSPLQQQAFQMAPEASFAGTGTLGAGTQLAGMSGTTAAPDIINKYMNPYTQTVVDELARQQQQNIQRNVLPALRAAGVATGGYGSSRQAGMTGQTLADMEANLLGQQYQALNTGYNTAMTSAQADLNRQLQAGQTLGGLGTQQQNVSITGLKQLSDLGALQQAQGQRYLDYPMTQAEKFSKLMQGYTIPTGTVQQQVAPGQQGQFAQSPLSAISGIASLIASIYGTQNTTSLNPAQISQAAKDYGLTLQPDGTYVKGGITYVYNQTTGQFQPKAAGGGLIETLRGSTSPLAMNDAMNGNTLTYTQ
jgi:hypothetical protein